MCLSTRKREDKGNARRSAVSLRVGQESRQTTLGRAKLVAVVSAGQCHLLSGGSVLTSDGMSDKIDT